MRQSETLSTDIHDVCIRGVLLMDNSERRDITISAGRIAAIEPHGSRLPDTVEHELDANGCLALPGMIDLYSRCREPGLTRKGSIASESRAALAAGFTHLLCTPDTLPAVDSVATVELISHRSRGVNDGARVIPMAALTAGLQGVHLAELATLQAAGCPVASQADTPLLSTTVLCSAMEYASSFDMPLLLTARDAQLGIDGCAHNGAVAAQLGLPTIPVAAETVALSRLIELARDTQCQLHISRISSARAVEQMNDAKQAGISITCDVGIHHLFYTDELLAGYDASFHSAVPFRSIADRKALRDGLASGVIDAISSDHAPHDIDAGLAPFPSTEPGLSAYDWFIPLLLQVPALTGLSLEHVIDKLHACAAMLCNLPGDSELKPGGMADFFVLDPAQPFVSKQADILSTGINNPLAIHAPAALGLAPLHGKVLASFSAGWGTFYNR